MTKNARPNTEDWRELYQRIKEALQIFGEDEEAGVGDYFLIDDIIEPHTHLLQVQKLHMLRPEIMASAQRALRGFPDWQIKVFVIAQEEKTIIDSDNGLILRSDGIVDILIEHCSPRNIAAYGIKGAVAHPSIRVALATRPPSPRALPMLATSRRMKAPSASRVLNILRKK